MSEQVGSLHYDLSIDDSKLKGQLDAAGKAIQNNADKIGAHWDKTVGASQKVLAGVTAVAAGTVAFGVSSVKAFQESQLAIAQTENVIKSTGGAAGVTASQVDKLSSSLQRSTRFSDEQVRGAQNLLLTFTQINKDIFPETTQLTLDMATAMGMDANQAALQLGKALNDPAEGFTRLKRVGVTFNEEQEKAIKTMTAAGNVAGAQKVILQELQKEFGGSAVAAGNTFAGQLDKLKNAFDDLQEGIGMMIVQALQPLVVRFSDWIARVEEAGGLAAYLSAKVKENEMTLKLLAGTIAGAVTPAIISMTAAFTMLFIRLLPFMALGAALVYLWEENRLAFWVLTGAVIGLAAGIAVALLPAAIAATGAFASLAIAVIAATWPFILIGAVAAGAAYLIITHWDKVKAFLIGAFEWVQRNWPMLLGMLVAPFATAVGWIISHWQRVNAFFGGVPGQIVRAIGNVAGALYGVGIDLVQGMINGVQARIGAVGQAVKMGVEAAVKGVKAFLGIRSPSKVFAEIGRNVTAGFVQGIEATQSSVINAMNGLNGSVLSPSISMAGAGGGVVNNQNGGNTYVEIGQINDRSDADYLIDRIDQRTQTQVKGGAPL